MSSTFLGAVWAVVGDAPSVSGAEASGNPLVFDVMVEFPGGYVGGKGDLMKEIQGEFGLR